MTQTDGPSSRQGPAAVIVIVAIVVGAVAALGYYAFGSRACSGYPPGGNCVAPYSYSFPISVNYTGPWKLTYTGQTNVGESNPTNVTGARTGNGYYSMRVTLAGLNDRMLSVCAQAQKLDASNSTLLLGVGPLYPKNTSAPYGSVSTCGGAAP